MDRVVFGSIETVAVPSLQLDCVTAKVDTGAWSGALHCTNINKNGDSITFTPLGVGKESITVSDFKFRQVRSANGQVEDRYIVPLEITVRGESYKIELGLSDRSEMQHEMLLGRKFLIENEILVDVLLTLEDDHEAEKFL